MQTWLRTNLKYSLILLLAAFIAGCSGGGRDKQEEAKMRLTGLAPDKLVTQLFSTFQFADYDEAYIYFSKDISEKVIDGFLSWLREDRSIGRFWTALVHQDADTATVMVKYNYNPKNLDTGFIVRENKVAETEIHLVKENGIWKVRSMGIEQFDKRAENDIFLGCLNAVMDATIAQEKIRMQRDSYTDNLASLLKTYSIDEMACEQITIEEAGEEDYLIGAVTRNMVPCIITANTDGYQPASYEECESTMYLPERDKETPEQPAEEEAGTETSS